MNWRPSYALAVLGVLSHLGLDFTNAYGIRLFLPWSTAWPSLDITSVVDVWIWAVFALCIFGPYLSRLISSEIGGSRSAGQGSAILFLVFVLSWNAARYVCGQRAIRLQDSRVYQGYAPRRVLIFPDAFSPLRWRGAVETDQFWVLNEINLLTPFDPTAGRMLFKPEPSAAITTAGATLPFQYLREFSKGLIWKVEPLPEPEGGLRVKAVDVRFGAPPRGGFEATAIIDPQGHVQRSWFSFSGSPGR